MEMSDFIDIFIYFILNYWIAARSNYKQIICILHKTLG
jgi:hypothetical protein